MEPLTSIPYVSETMAYQMDLLKHNSQFVRLSELPIGSHVQVQAARGVLNFVSRETIKPLATGMRAEVAEGSTLEEVDQGQIVAINGATAGGSLIRAGVIAPGNHLEFGVSRDQIVDVPKLAQETDMTHQEIMDLPTVSRAFRFDDDGLLHNTIWRRFLTGIVTDVQVAVPER